MRYIICVCALALGLAGCATSSSLSPVSGLDLMGSGSDELGLDAPPAGPALTAVGDPDGSFASLAYDEDPAAEQPAPPAPPVVVEETPVTEPEAVSGPTPDDAYAEGTIVRGGSAYARTAGSCCDCCDPTWPCSYLEIRTELLPGIGVGVNYGRRFGRAFRGTVYGEVGVSFQDMWEPFTGEEEAGDWWQARVGVRWEAACDYCARFQPYVRGGLSFMSLSGNLQDIKQSTFNFDEDGDYFGGYVAVGLNLALGRMIRMGPEIGVSGGWGQGDFGWTPQFSWNLDIDF